MLMTWKIIFCIQYFIVCFYFNSDDELYVCKFIPIYAYNIYIVKYAHMKRLRFACTQQEHINYYICNIPTIW